MGLSWNFFCWPDDPGCVGCRYYRRLYNGDGGTSSRACHYALDRHQVRRCQPGAECTEIEETEK